MQEFQKRTRSVGAAIHQRDFPKHRKQEKALGTRSFDQKDCATGLKQFEVDSWILKYFKTNDYLIQ